MATWRAGARGPRVIASPRYAGHREVDAARTSRPLPPPLPPAITSIRAPFDTAQRCAAEHTLTARHVGVAPSIVNNNPETSERSRRSFPTATGWCFTRSSGRARSWVAALSCPGRSAARSGALQIRDRSSLWRSRISGAPLHFVTRCTASGTRDSVGRVRNLIHFSNSPSPSRDAFCARGFATLLHSPRIEGWAERRETFGCSGTRWACT